MTIFNKYYMIVIDQERRMVMARGTRYSQEFKEDAVQISFGASGGCHFVSAAENLGISESALKSWMKSAKEHEGDCSDPWFRQLRK